MIVDCHTHIWESLDQLGRATGLWEARGRRQGLAGPPKASTAEHLAATDPVDKTFVLGFKSRHVDAEVPNESVAAYVRKHADRLMGFAAVDPSCPTEAVDDVRRAHEKLGMQGVVVWPGAQDFHPASSGAMRVYAEACRLRMPVIFDMDVQICGSSKMEFARPYLLDEVARELPGIRMVIAHVGHPWIEETLALLGKNNNVFADVGGLLHYQWHTYNALVLAYEAGVMDKLLFSSDFPYALPAACIESLYSINHLCHGTNLPTIPREQLRRIVERNTLELLGIEQRMAPVVREPDRTVIQTED